jgi:hypothetical protein
MVFEGIIKRVDPELDFQDEARRFILRTKYGIMPPRSFSQILVDNNIDTKLQPPDSDMALTA